MKTKQQKITLDTVLASMKPGQRYTAHDLARNADVPLSTVRQLLGSDRALTRLDISSSKRGRMFALAGSCGGERHVDTRVRPDFTSNLSGYVRGLDAHRMLAMTTRGAR
ncbi:putative phage DNA-binding protein [Burkholderia multivorans]